jgi:hypothetical protein
MTTSFGDERREFRCSDPPLTRNENEHPECAYMRGYQQGAHAVLEALRAWETDPQVIKKVERFVGTVGKWRYTNRRRLGRHLIKDAAPRLVEQPHPKRMKEIA